MQADLYHNRLFKPEKTFFSCRTLYIRGMSIKYVDFLNISKLVYDN